MPNQDATLQRLNEQIEWYDKNSTSSQKWYKRFKVMTIISAALVPVLSLAKAEPIYTASLGVLLIVLEGIQQVNQFQTNSSTYRTTCEALKREKYLFLAGAGPYGSMSASLALLAERVESLVAQEHYKLSGGQDTPPSSRPMPQLLERVSAASLGH